MKHKIRRWIEFKNEYAIVCYTRSSFFKMNIKHAINSTPAYAYQSNISFKYFIEEFLLYQLYKGHQVEGDYVGLVIGCNHVDRKL